MCSFVHAITSSLYCALYVLRRGQVRPRTSRVASVHADQSERGVVYADQPYHDCRLRPRCRLPAELFLIPGVSLAWLLN